MSTVRAPLQIGDTIRFTRTFLQSMATVTSTTHYAGLDIFPSSRGAN